MRPVAIVQHLADGPAFFASWLQAHGIPFTLHRMHLGEALPADILACAGLCILGGAMSANDPLPYYPALLDQVRQAVAVDIPVIGHCLGWSTHAPHPRPCSASARSDSAHATAGSGHS